MTMGGQWSLSGHSVMARPATPAAAAAGRPTKQTAISECGLRTHLRADYDPPPAIPRSSGSLCVKEVLEGGR